MLFDYIFTCSPDCKIKTSDETNVPIARTEVMFYDPNPNPVILPSQIMMS